MKRFPVILCIDALDECGQELAVKLIEDLKNLLSSIPSTTSRFGICFSCRHYPILDLQGESTIVLDTENKTDIATFVRARFSTRNIDGLMQENIYSRAQGVFMWAHLVVDRVLRMKREGKPNGKIESEIQIVPQDLDNLYRELIQGVEDRSDALKLMQWICFSTRPLRVDELQWAMAVNPDSTHRSLDGCHHSDDFITDENIDRRIKTLSCGLTEIVPSANGHVVQFIHQSVHDFFIERGLWLLDQTREPDLVDPSAHYRLSRSCIRYIGMVVVHQSGSLGRQDQFNFPFLHYATTSWVSHVKLGEPAEKSPNDLLDCLGWPTEPLIESWAEIHREMEPYSSGCPSRGSNLVHVVSRYGLTKLLPYLLLDTGKVDIDARDTEYGQTPLWWATRNGHEAAMKMLLDTGKVDVDTRDTQYSRTPLWWATVNGHGAVMKMLLKTGKVDVDARDIEYGQTPL